MNDKTIINVEDYPEINPDTKDGQEDLGGIAASMHFRNPSKRHFIFQRGGEYIGEMIIPPPAIEQN